MPSRAAVAVLVGIFLLTLVRLASTYSVFSQTVDEPVHVLAGWAWLRLHDSTMDPEHPPLARILFALPFRNTKITPGEDWIESGNQLYAATGDYLGAVAKARRGNLVFVFVALIGVTLWGHELFGTTVGVIACAVFAMLPPMLAHGGLATTDMAGTAAYALAMFALYRWLDRPTWMRTFGLAVVAGLGLVTKFSFIPFFGFCSVIAMAAKRRLPVFKGFIAMFVAVLIVSSIYFFDYQTLDDVDSTAPQTATELFGSAWIAQQINLPAPGFIDGLMQVALHNQHGHESYLFGRLSKTGWWYYFPVVLLMKSPLPLLILAIAGCWLTTRRNDHREVQLYALAILGIAMTSHIDIGVRHVLPIYVPLAILAAYTIVALWFTRAQIAVTALSAWLVVGSLLAHPDYLPWMNMLAGPHPERILIDSNLDWGQDVVRLRTECRRRGVDRLGALLFGFSDLKRIGLPPTYDINASTPSKGWIAVSESAILPPQIENPSNYAWLTTNYPYIRVGKSIRLYHIP